MKRTNPARVIPECCVTVFCFLWYKWMLGKRKRDRTNENKHEKPTSSYIKHLDDLQMILLDCIGIREIGGVIESYYDSASWVFSPAMSYQYNKYNFLHTQPQFEDFYFHELLKKHFPWLLDLEDKQHDLILNMHEKLRILELRHKNNMFSDIPDKELTFFHLVCLACSNPFSDRLAYRVSSLYIDLWRMVHLYFDRDVPKILSVLTIFVQLAARLKWINVQRLWMALLWTFILQTPENLMLAFTPFSEKDYEILGKQIRSTCPLFMRMMFQPVKDCVAAHNYFSRKMFLEIKDKWSPSACHFKPSWKISLDTIRKQSLTMYSSCTLNGRGLFCKKVNFLSDYAFKFRGILENQKQVEWNSANEILSLGHHKCKTV